MLLFKGPIAMNETEYADLVVQVIKGFLRPGRDCMTAAALGETLRRSVSDVSWKTFGHKTLGDFLRTPQFNPALELAKTDKGALGVKLKVHGPASDAEPIKRYNRLERAIWGAFVMANPPGRRFLNRKSGAVRAGIQVAPNPVDEWIEIQPISVVKQKSWVNDFLTEANIPFTAAITAALDETNWNFRLSTSLGDHAPHWNRYRSAKVAEIVDKWCSEYSVPHDLVFHSGEMPSRDKDVPTLQSPPADSLDDIRHVILAALASLPTERLLEIPIPAGSILAAMRSKPRV